MVGSAKAGFDYVLDRLPFNKHRLSTDASTSFGMAGVLRFAKHPREGHSAVDGLF